MPAATAPAVERQTLSVSEAATYLGVSRSTLTTLVRAGELPSIKLRRRRLFTKAALDHLLESVNVRRERPDF